MIIQNKFFMRSLGKFAGVTFFCLSSGTAFASTCSLIGNLPYVPYVGGQTENAQSIALERDGDQLETYSSLDSAVSAAKEMVSKGLCDLQAQKCNAESAGDGVYEVNIGIGPPLSAMMAMGGPESMARPAVVLTGSDPSSDITRAQTILGQLRSEGVCKN